MSRENKQNISESKTQALRALISSIALGGEGSSDRLRKEQVLKLSERLEQILGDVPSESTERKNEKGELLNEEGLPIIDITEPIDENDTSTKSTYAFTTEEDPIPFSALTERERQALRTQQEQILDELEKEEEELRKTVDQESRYLMEDFDKKASDVKAEEERRRDARELQKKMGKALIRNVSKQREEDERARKKDALAMVESQRASSSRKGKPRKSVSFANVPDMGEDESKSRRKASLAWGDTSVGVMRGGMNRARLTVNDLERRTMRLDVVERISGQPPLPNFREKNSDDESEPENDSSHVNYDKITNTTQNLDDSDSGSSPMDSSSKDEEESEDNNFELSQAQLQRDIALEYIKMRETIGSEAHNAMISHTHEGTDEWDQPEVPLEATLASKPPKPTISRFKASRQVCTRSSDDTSVSLGQSVLPRGKSHTIQKSVRNGKLINGKLMGGPEGESGSDGENNEAQSRMLGMLKKGNVWSSGPNISDITTTVDGAAISAQLPSKPGTSQRETESATKVLNSKKHSSSVASTVKERQEGIPLNSSSPPGENAYTKQSSISTHRQFVPDVQERTSLQNLPSAIPVPAIPRLPSFATPQIKPDPAVLSTIVVESPSFPPPNSRSVSSTRQIPLVSEVRESRRDRNINDGPSIQRPSGNKEGRISRFKAERL